MNTFIRVLIMLISTQLEFLICLLRRGFENITTNLCACNFVPPVKYFKIKYAHIS